MSTLIQCSGCGKRYKVGDDLAGKPVRCGCGETLIVPESQSPGADGDAAEGQLDESLYGVIAAGGPAPGQQIAADDIPDDLLDETIWDTEAKAESRAASTVETVEAATGVDRSPAAPAIADDRPRPTATDDPEDEPETFWDRFKSPSRELIGWLAIGYGAAMTLLLIVMMAPVALMLLQFSALALIVLILTRGVWIAVAASIAVGGVLMHKRHPLGPPCAGLGSAAICFAWMWSLLWQFLPLHKFLAVFAVEFGFIYAIPAYIIYWCLKEEEAIDEAKKRDDIYAIRDALKDRAIEENLKEWESK